MIEVSGSLAALLSNAWPAAVLALSITALLRLLGLSRTGGATTAGISVGIAFLPAGWGPALLLAAAHCVGALIRRLTGAEPRPGALQALALGGPGALFPWALLALGHPVYWLTALAGWCTAGAASSVLRRAAPDDATATRLASMRTIDSGSPGWRRRGVIAAMTMVAILPVIAYVLEILGPGDPALVVLGSWAALAVVGTWSIDRPDGSRLLACGAAGAVFCTALVAFIP